MEYQFFKHVSREEAENYLHTQAILALLKHDGYLIQGRKRQTAWVGKWK